MRMNEYFTYRYSLAIFHVIIYSGIVNSLLSRSWGRMLRYI